MNYYYIVESIGLSTQTDPLFDIRLLIISDRKVFSRHPVFQIDDGEGPYESLKQLKDNSELFQKLLNQNPSRAAKICQKSMLLEVVEEHGAYYHAIKDDAFDREVSPLLNHTLNGSFGRNDVFGIHFFDPKKIEILHILGFDQATGVQQAVIRVYNTNSNKWIVKKIPTTFFPFNWTTSDIIQECQTAFYNKVQVSETRYKGITKRGVLVVFIHDRTGKLKTVYPVCEELEIE